MSSAMTLMKKLSISTPARGLVAVALDTASGAGASYLIGQAHTRYRDKWYGKNVAKIAVGVGKLGAVALSLSHGGHANYMTTLLNSVGQAGVNAMALDLGLKHGNASTGRKAVLLPADTDVKKIAGASDVASMGALGQAAPGRGLSWDQIEELATGR